MDVAIGITVGASARLALLVAPVLVFLSMIMGHDMDLIFSPGELIAIVMSVCGAKPQRVRRVKLAKRSGPHRRLLPVRDRVPEPAP
jgi:hypothetical protein